MFRRFLDAVLGRADLEPTRPIVVGYHWTKYGKDRLYLHRITAPGAKQELGWFDLDLGRAHPNNAEASSLVEYCGRRFRHVVTA